MTKISGDVTSPDGTGGGLEFVSSFPIKIEDEKYVVDKVRCSRKISKFKTQKTFKYVALYKRKNGEPASKILNEVDR